MRIRSLRLNATGIKKMKYATASTRSTQECYNKALIVNSVHKSFDLARKAQKSTLGIVAVSDEIKKGDVIDEHGNIWKSAYA